MVIWNCTSAVISFLRDLYRETRISITVFSQENIVPTTVIIIICNNDGLVKCRTKNNRLLEVSVVR